MDLYLSTDQEFRKIRPEDLWVYNKLQLSVTLGYDCGPIGVNVSRSGYYIIRPCINFIGMGRFARKIWLDPGDDTEKFGIPGEFWCEYFEGEHISVDYYRRRQFLTVLGTKGADETSKELTKWDKWEKVDRHIEFPHVLDKVWRNYETINCEFIGGKLIEAHFRHNPDFIWGNSEAIPVGMDENICPPAGYSFRPSPDYGRKGFYIK